MVLDVKKIKGTRRVAKGFMGKGIWFIRCLDDDLLKRRKGHVYNTIVVDLKSGRIPHVGQGKAAMLGPDFGKESDERSSTSSISPPISLPLSSPPYLKLPERGACLRPFSCGQTHE